MQLSSNIKTNHAKIVFRQQSDWDVRCLFFREIQEHLAQHIYTLSEWEKMDFTFSKWLNSFIKTATILFFSQCGRNEFCIWHLSAFFVAWNRDNVDNTFNHFYSYLAQFLIEHKLTLDYERTKKNSHTQTFTLKLVLAFAHATRVSFRASSFGMCIWAEAWIKYSTIDFHNRLCRLFSIEFIFQFMRKKKPCKWWLKCSFPTALRLILLHVVWFVFFLSL